MAPELENGELLKIVEAAGFDVMVTSFQYVRFKPKSHGTEAGFSCVAFNICPSCASMARRSAKVEAATPGSYEFIEMPLPPRRRTE